MIIYKRRLSGLGNNASDAYAYITALDWSPATTAYSTQLAFNRGVQMGWTAADMGSGLGFTGPQIIAHFASYGLTWVDPAPVSSPFIVGGSTSSSGTYTAPAPAPTPTPTPAPTPTPTPAPDRINAIKSSLSSISLSRPDMIYQFIEENQITYDELQSAMGWDAAKVNAILLQGANMLGIGTGTDTANSTQAPADQSSTVINVPTPDGSSPVNVTVSGDSKGLMIGLAIIGGILLLK